MKVKELINILEQIDEELEIRVIDMGGNILDEQGIEIEDVIEITQHNSEEDTFWVVLRTK